MRRLDPDLPHRKADASLRRLNDNVLLAGDVAAPLIDVALAELRIDPHLQADESSVRLQNRRERAFVWTFLSKLCTVYVFDPISGRLLQASGG